MARRHLPTGLSGLILAGATALAAEERPAPDYFLDAVIEISTAQSLALSCTEVSVNPAAMALATDQLIDRLVADGFDINAEGLGMADSSDGLAARQDAFLARHGLANGAGEAAVCAAAEAEMAAQSGIGGLLLAVED